MLDWIGCDARAFLLVLSCKSIGPQLPNRMSAGVRLGAGTNIGSRLNSSLVVRREVAAMLRRIAISLALAFLVALPATAQDFQKGVAAYTRGDYATAIREWRPLVTKGNAKAQHNLGFMYFYGEGVSQSYSVAMRWWHKAAEQGYAKAQFSIGATHALGYGVHRDYVLAHKWLSLSAAQDDRNAIGLRNFLAKRMTPAQIAEARELAREWMAKHKKNWSN